MINKLLTQSLRRLVYSNESIKNNISSLLLAISAQSNFGTNIFEEEWDLLIILDACRFDALQALITEEQLFNNVVRRRSVGSATLEWAAKTFIERYSEEIAETALISGNGTVSLALKDNPQYWAGTPERRSWIDSLTTWDTVNSEDFFLHDKVWEYGYRDPYTGNIMPECITDRTISVARNSNPSRIIAHYLPPHAPYRSEAIRENRELFTYERNPWENLQSGMSRDVVWESYINEIRWGLTNIEVLLENIDAEKVVITADHGEAFGEYGVYAHPAGIPLRQLRNVPWVVTTAADHGTYSPSLDIGKQLDIKTQERLRRLGYL